jgi:hypothetical protein
MKDRCPFLRSPCFTHDVLRPAACERPPRSVSCLPASATGESSGVGAWRVARAGGASLSVPTLGLDARRHADG